MELRLDRLWRISERTLGCLYVDSHFFCFTLEDKVRDKNTPKIPHKTAIPDGRYKVVLVNSPKFGPDTPSLEDVPNFTFVRIHAGNDETDTDGCILVGDSLAEDGKLRESRIARDRLKLLLKKIILSGGEIFIEIKTLFNGAAGPEVLMIERTPDVPK